VVLNLGENARTSLEREKRTSKIMGKLKYKRVRVFGLGREWFLAALPYPFDSYHDQVNATLPSSILLYHGGRGGRNLDFNIFFLTKKQVFVILCIFQWIAADINCHLSAGIFYFNVLYSCCREIKKAGDLKGSSVFHLLGRCKVCVGTK
jgi:hypothetical protein